MDDTTLAFTLGDIVTKVRLRVRDTGYSATEIYNYINDTQNDVFNEYRLRFMQTSQNYTMAVGVADLTNGSGLPTNFVQAIKVTLTTTGREKELKFVNFEELSRLYPDLDDTTAHPNNVPEFAYIFGNTIKVFPAPSAALTATLFYYKKPTVLDADADIPELPSEFEELLVVGAAYRVLQVKDNYDQAAILEGKYMELLDKLVSKYTPVQVGRATVMRINRV